MTTKTKNRPAKATVARVQDQLSVIARTTSDIANVTNLSPATVRRCLTVLADEGAAAKNDQGQWVSARPPEGPTRPDDTGHSVVDAPPASRVGNQPVKKTTKASKTAKATKKAKGKGKANGIDNRDKTASWLRDLGFSEALAEQDAALVDLLRDAPQALSKQEIFERLGQFSDWSFRRMSEGRHGKLDFKPLIEPVGRGEARVWQVVEQ